MDGISTINSILIFSIKQTFPYIPLTLGSTYIGKMVNVVMIKIQFIAHTVGRRHPFQLLIKCSCFLLTGPVMSIIIFLFSLIYQIIESLIIKSNHSITLLLFPTNQKSRIENSRELHSDCVVIRRNNQL